MSASTIQTSYQKTIAFLASLGIIGAAGALLSIASNKFLFFAWGLEFKDISYFSDIPFSGINIFVELLTLAAFGYLAIALFYKLTLGLIPRRFLMKFARHSWKFVATYNKDALKVIGNPKKGVEELVRNTFNMSLWALLLTVLTVFAFSSSEIIFSAFDIGAHDEFQRWLIIVYFGGSTAIFVSLSLYFNVRAWKLCIRRKSLFNSQFQSLVLRLSSSGFALLFAIILALSAFERPSLILVGDKPLDCPMKSQELGLVWSGEQMVLLRCQNAGDSSFVRRGDHFVILPRDGLKFSSISGDGR